MTGLTAVRGRYEYRFATKENLDRFSADPEAWSIRFGGACMRMGPLSGRGDPARWHVHGERIYIFASESCRKTFSEDPERFIDVAAPTPMGTEVQKERAGQLLAKAVEALGGEERLLSVQSAVTKTMSCTYRAAIQQ